MSLQTRISDLATRVGTEFKTVRTEIAGAGGGDLLASNNLSELVNDATARTNLDVDSSGEVDAKVAAVTLAGLGGLTQAQVDARASLASGAVTLSGLGGLTQAEVDARASIAVATVVDGAPAALDTLNEIAAALGDDANAITDLLTSVGNRLRFDAVQTLDGTQQTQGQTNLNVVSATAIGDTDSNFVTTFETGLI